MTKSDIAVEERSVVITPPLRGLIRLLAQLAVEQHLKEVCQNQSPSDQANPWTHCNRSVSLNIVNSHGDKNEKSETNTHA